MPHTIVHSPQSQGTQCALLALPPELRNQIYLWLLPSSIDTYAETCQLPSLLEACHQLQREYSSVFFGSALIQVDAYYAATDTWCTIDSAMAKQTVLERAVFLDMFKFWSLASVVRFCQKREYAKRGVQRGVLTVYTPSGLRRWQWNAAA